jgi:phosphotransferase system HPr (HPr) family protein
MVTVTITSKNGLHARPASLIVNACQGFDSEITLSSNGQSANGKSIMNLLSLGLQEGAVVEVSAVGPDAEQAEKEIKEILGADYD